MKRPAQLAAIGALVVLLASTVVLFVRYQQTSRDYADTKAAEEAARTSYGNAINSIAEIQDSLNAIAVGDSSLQMRGGLRTEGGRATQDREALERIAVLKASVERAKQRIQELETDLSKSGVKVAGLQKMIAGLKKDVAEHETTIARLTGQVDSLNTTVTALNGTVAAKTDTIGWQSATLETRRRELNTIYYVVGDKKTLMEDGILVAKGGVLGIGKTLAPSGNFVATHFAPLDLDEQTVLRIPSKRVQVLSEQPLSSYTIEVVSDSLTELRVTDPTGFRAVKHLVIMKS